MEASIDDEVAKLLPHIGAGAFVAEEKKLKEVHENATLIGAGSDSRTVLNDAKIGRNELCPCGSGKKYKNCGLKNTEEHKRLINKK
jgi:uncharacterized protein YecA (UPF0149 family)